MISSTTLTSTVVWLYILGTSGCSDTSIQLWKIRVTAFPVEVMGVGIAPHDDETGAAHIFNESHYVLARWRMSRRFAPMEVDLDDLNHCSSSRRFSWEALMGSSPSVSSLAFRSRKTSAKTVLGTKPKNIKPWIGPETWNEIQNRKKLRNAIFRSKCPATKTQARIAYRESARKVTYMIRIDRERYLNEIANDAEQASNTGNLRGVYTAIKELCGNNIRGTAILKANDGSDLTTTEEQLVRWCDYFTSQSTNRIVSETDILITRRNPRRAISTDPPTTTEIIAILDNMKNCKSAGPDNIAAELLKYGSNTIGEYLTPLIHNAWVNNNIPNDWKEGTVITIPKKGDLTLCKNWRGITLLNSICKIIATLILQKIQPVIDETLRKEQAGFRPGRSCVDHVNTLRIIIEQSIEYNSPLYLLFIDFERAFDTVYRDAIWLTLLTYQKK
ncbi:uncharacterized protein [Musca autumnalis]|uniref:uncharacterized protein n=1 Tax=Musca autumnalis TaxID=221902 RepID=UPI003CF9777D